MQWYWYSSSSGSRDTFISLWTDHYNGIQAPSEKVSTNAIPAELRWQCSMVKKWSTMFGTWSTLLWHLFLTMLFWPCSDHVHSWPCFMFGTLKSQTRKKYIKVFRDWLWYLMKSLIIFITPHLKILDSGLSRAMDYIIVMFSSLLSDRLLSLTAYGLIN